MPRDTANEKLAPRVDVASRMVITFKRVTKRGKPAEGENIGKPLEWLNESFSLVHNNRELGEMFANNPATYIDVKYEKVEAFI